MGKFVMKATANGGFKFDLKAGNGEVIASSQVYKSQKACEAGIESVRKNGRWVAKGSGQKLSDAYSQGVTLYIIDPKDWSLINEVSFSVRLNYNENGKNVLGMNQVERYLNELFDGES